MKRILHRLPECPACAGVDLHPTGSHRVGTIMRRHVVCRGCGEKLILDILNPRPLKNVPTIGQTPATIA